MDSKLPPDYSIREMSAEELEPRWRENLDKVFSNRVIFRPHLVQDEAQKAQVEELATNMGEPYALRLGVFHGQELVGWHVGFQKDRETFYMQNSAILPSHRRKGLYSALLADVLSRLQGKGFQVIYSRHSIVNNDILIPKLKAGFLITSFELSDVFGTLLHLTYFTNPARRKVVTYRAGNIFPDEQINQLLGL